MAENYMTHLKMTIVKAASEQNVYSQIFRPITTTRLQVVAEKSYPVIELIL